MIGAMTIAWIELKSASYPCASGIFGGSHGKRGHGSFWCRGKAQKEQRHMGRLNVKGARVRGYIGFVQIVLE